MRVMRGQAHQRAARRRRRRQGFTLLELMIALAIGTLVVGTVYTLGGASARAFQEQQRISQLQLATRLAMDRVRRDVALAGFGGTPDSQVERTCGGTAFPSRLIGLSVFDADPTGASAIAAMPGGSLAGTETDRIRILGNLVTADSYLIANTGDASATSILLQSNWQGFRRSFASDATGMTFDTALFAEVFPVGRLVHIEHPRGYHFVTRVTSATVDSAGRSPRIGVSPPLPAADECNFALCVGCMINPLVGVDYLIAPAPVGFAPRDVQVTGANTVLLRREVDPVSGAMVSERVVLEYAVELSALLAIDRAVAGAAPDIQWQTSPASGAIANPARIRAARISLSARSQEIDPAFAGPLRTTSGVLTAFTPFTDRIGASRVRTSMAEIMLPNLAYRGL